MQIPSPLPTLLIDPVSGSIHCCCPDVCLPNGCHHYELYLLDPAEYVRKVEERDRSTTAYRELVQELTEARRHLAVEQGHCDDLHDCNRNLLDNLDSARDQCQVTEEECTGLTSKVQTLEESVASLTGQLSVLKQQTPEPKWKKTHHSSSSPALVSTNNSFIDALARSNSSFIYLPVAHAHEFFSWVCFGGDSSSIQKGVYFLDKHTCSTSSLLGTSWTHGLLPPYPKPCEPALHERYDCLRIVVHLTICKLAGIEGLFHAHRSFYGIDLPSNPGTYDFTR
jgi:hypothetical protein